MRKRTPKQEKFALAYFELGDASAAYRHAYSAERMSAQSVHKEAQRLLNNPQIAPRIDELRAAVTVEVVVATADVVRGLHGLATDGEAPANARVAAWRALGDYTGGFSKRHEHSGPEGGPIPVLVGIANLTEDELRSLASGRPSA